MDKRPEIQLADLKAMREASRIYKPALLDIQEIRRNENKKKRGRVN